jgi:hypothetical protein
MIEIIWHDRAVRDALGPVRLGSRLARAILDPAIGHSWLSHLGIGVP